MTYKINNNLLINAAQKVSIIFLLAVTFITLFAVAGTFAAESDADMACGAFPVNVATELQLNEAIDCFNTKTVPGSYSINFTSDIDLTASTVAIDNTAAGVVLLVTGNNFALDGNDVPGLRPMLVHTDTVATVTNLTITRGNIDSVIGLLRNETSGGAILNYGNLTLNNATLIDNTSEDWGGAIFSEAGSSLTLLNSRIENNRAGEDGGGIQNFGNLDIDNSVISGNVATRFSGGIGINTLSGMLVIKNSMILGNQAKDGAGIYNRDGTLSLTDSVVSNNMATRIGGGILNNRGGANLVVNRTTISGNMAVVAGGGILNDQQAELQVLNSTISDNVISNSNVEGAGIYNDDSSTATVQNSTFSGNMADSAVANQGDLSLLHVTIASNGGVGLKNLTATVASKLSIQNTIIADHAVDCRNEEAGAITVNVTNLIETDSAGALACSNGSTLSADPQLMPLGDNGGSTLTHYFPVTSPVIDAANLTACETLNGLIVDQRASGRPAGTTCDIGAVEYVIGITVDDITVAEPNSGTGTATFVIRRSDNTQAVSVMVNTADGTATAGDDYVAIADQTVSFPVGGALTQNVTVQLNTDLAFEGDETFKLLLSDQVNSFIVDTEAEATVEESKSIRLLLSSPAPFVEENDTGTSDYTFTFVLEAPIPAVVVPPFTLNYMTQDGTAQVGDADYEFRSGTLSFDGGTGPANGRSFTVKVSGDTKSEADETFAVLVTAISNPSIGVAPLPFEAVIKNDDEPIVNFSSATYTETESSGSVAVTVNLSVQYSETVTVDVATADGTALAGSDYTAVSQTVSFAPGETTKNVIIPLADNEDGEPDETFTVGLSNIVNGFLGPQTSTTVTIEKDAVVDDGVQIYLPIVTK